MARVLITTFGSFGDLHPYLALGGELRRRGHRVTIGSSACFRGKVESAGLSFAPIRPDAELDNQELMKLVFHARKGSEFIIRAVAGVVGESYADTLAPAAGADLIVTHPLSFASTLIAKKRGIPWVSTVLAPVSMFSATDPPVIPVAPWLRHLTFLGEGFYRWLWRFARTQSIQWTRPVIELGQRELGLTPEQIGDPITDGAMSPWLVLALFSPLFGAPQADWPKSAMATGFPFLESTAELPPELERFFDAGPPPVVFTLGSSAVGAAGNFYQDSFRAVERLGVRTLFLTGSHAQGLPAQLPPGMMEWNYAPHAAVFARASVIVHQGGVGTTAEALRAGRPMLVVPFAHDQFDNAERCRKLGVARWIGRGSYSASRACSELSALLTSQEMPAACAAIAAKIRAENGNVTAADAIERLLR